MNCQRLVFVDLETAGLEPWRPIMQIAAVAVDRDLKEVECFESKIRFSHAKSDPHSLRKRRYEPRVWQQEARSGREAAEAFAAFLRRHASIRMKKPGGGHYLVAQLVAHNARHDGEFLQHWFDKLGLFLPGHFRMLCTLQRAVWYFQEQPEQRQPADFKLGTLCRHLGVSFAMKDEHDALNDTRATVRLYRTLTRDSYRPAQPRHGTRHGMKHPTRPKAGKTRHGQTRELLDSLLSTKPRRVARVVR